ncbi:MAG: ABC-2 family transporter protein, partial [Candidatus Gracilibacteria bacterium]|nr:ABC-2 family transporter protein [Candidatus Gracilibacteria bacterium]
MIRIMLQFWKLNFLRVLEYRWSLVTQALGMMISDTITIVIWIFFFDKLGKIGGMGLNDYVILYSVLLFVFSYVHVFFGGYQEIAENIMNGRLDSYLLLPKNELILMLVNSFKIYALGDLFFGIGILFFIKGASLLFIGKILILSLFGALIFLGFMILFQSLTFYMGSSRELSRAMFELMLGPTHYPPKIYEGSFLKILFLTVMPVYYAFFFPYELVQEFNLTKFLYVVLATIFFLS